MANLDKAKAAAQGRIDKLIAQGGDVPMPPSASAMTDMPDPLDIDPMAGDDMGGDDAESGYVEVAGGPTCGNCLHLEGTRCTLPLVNKDVSPEDGCCNYWDDGSGQPGIQQA